MFLGGARRLARLAAGGILTAGCLAAGPAAPAAPAPVITADHLLDRLVGTWDATLQIAAPDDSPPAILSGTEVVAPGPGGAWVTADFRSLLDGKPFQGHALLVREGDRFRRVWVDSSSPLLFASEGTWDPGRATLTLWVHTLDSSGRPVRWREETVFKGADDRTFTMFVPGPETTEASVMSIVYHRRPAERASAGAAPGPVPHAIGDAHDLLRRAAGRWDARVVRRADPEARAASDDATATGVLCCGGLFLITDVRGRDGTEPFRGHGITGYDPGRKQYVGAWIDSDDPVLRLRAGAFDAKADTLTLEAQGDPGTGGREVVTWKGHERRTATVEAPGPGGSAYERLSIRYRRAR